MKKERFIIRKLDGLKGKGQLDAWNLRLYQLALRFEQKLTMRRSGEIQRVSNKWKTLGPWQFISQFIQASTWQSPVNEPQNCSRNQKRIENGSRCRWLRKICGHSSSHFFHRPLIAITKTFAVFSAGFYFAREPSEEDKYNSMSNN